MKIFVHYLGSDLKAGMYALDDNLKVEFFLYTAANSKLS